MGQGQSDTDKSNPKYTAKSSSKAVTKGKKSRRKSSNKTNSGSNSMDTTHATTAATTTASSSSRNQPAPTITITANSSSHSTTASTAATNSSVSVSTTSSHNSYSNHHHHHSHSSNNSHQRGSFSGGGERSAPSRQFSLTRQTSSHSSTQNKHAQIEKYFNKYKDNVEESILADGMEKFCVDLGVDPTEFIVLVLAWKFEASQMCRFTREEFINGCQKMQAHNAKSLRERFPDLLAEAKSQKNFKDLYNFTFSFGLDHSTGQRSLPIDMALPLWDLVFTQNRPEILDRWFEFLKNSGVRGIPRDTWNMFLPFVEAIYPDLSNYDESEAWPSLFDDFVESELEEKTAM